MSYFALKSLHIIFVVTWFAGLFYIVRLFVYHSEAAKKPEPERSILFAHFKKAEKPLWYGITWPSAIGTYIFGLWLAYTMYGWNFPGWLIIKFIFVVFLTIYHYMCGVMYSRYQRDEIKYSGMYLRIWNEVATVILVAVVFLVVYKDQVSWVWGVVGLLIFSGLLMLGIQTYKRIREKSGN